MSLLSTFSRLLQGKPPFTPNDQQPSALNGDQPAASEAPQAAPGQPASTIVKGDASTFPEVCVKNTKIEIDGQNMQVYCEIVNNSNQAIVLDRMNLVGVETRLLSDLAPNQSREYLVYKGPFLPSQGPSEAQLNYKTVNGDYFASVHDVTYRFQSDSNTYVVDMVRLRPPIRDIYG
jgi:hypothetical protein